MPVDAHTDPDTGLRFYDWQGTPLLSVTSIRRVVGMPFPLATWQVNQALDAGVRAMTGEDLMPLGAGPDDLRKALRANAMSVRDKSADLGTRVHAAAATGIDKEDAELAPFIKQYESALTSLDLDVLLQEEQVFNLTLGYAGSLDLIAQMDDLTCLVDLKTGKGLYTDHILQLVAYTMAEFIGRGGIVDEHATKLLHEVTTLAILHISPTDWEWVEVRPNPSTYQAFGAMVGLADWMLHNPDIEPHVLRRITGKGI